MAKDEPFSSKLCLLPARTGGFSSSMITLSSDEQELSVQKNIVQRVRQELRQGRASSWSLVGRGRGVVVVVVMLFCTVSLCSLKKKKKKKEEVFSLFLKNNISCRRLYDYKTCYTTL